MFVEEGLGVFWKGQRITNMLKDASPEFFRKFSQALVVVNALTKRAILCAQLLKSAYPKLNGVVLSLPAA